MKRRFTLAIIGLATAATLATGTASASATAAPRTPALRGTTAVTTAPGIAAALIEHGVLPLPIADTGFGIGFRGGLTVTYRFPITGGNPNLSGPSGDILHAGGINFVSYGAHLTISNFDIDLAAGKVFATRVDGAPARVAILDLNLAGLAVHSKHGVTVLTGITVTLDSAAASALDATFPNLNLPSGLGFGTATVTLRS